MHEMEFRSGMTVTVQRSLMDDQMVVQAARVSTVGENTPTDTAEGLIRYLMRNRHGSPFEHNSVTFYVEAPIFVFREFMRHRIGFSYNEESGRYKELRPIFYVPTRTRKLVQAGKPGAYTLVEGTDEQHELVEEELPLAYQSAYDTYEKLLKAGVCREVARDVLPVATYSSMYVTCNARSLMAFLSLRTEKEYAIYTSRPLAEIQMVADAMEAAFKHLMPITWQAFEDAGRVAP